jgi:GntR family transcriptional regulator/MocR family aminotransferase
MSRAVDLHLDVLGPGVLAGLTRALREAVRAGRLPPGTMLPSTRGLAEDLGIARNTVVAAYAQLVDEGWLTARQGAGTRVSDRYRAVAAQQKPPRVTEPQAPSYDLRPGRPDVSSFPRVEWTRATRRATERASGAAFVDTSPAGRIELRRALADYLARARGVYAVPERIVISAGASHGLALLAAALRCRRVDTVAVEAYGMPRHRDLLTRAGLRTLPLPLDQHGARTDRLGPGGAVLLTPAHQFPTGVALDPRRRTTVVDWARSTGGLVIEDDYDGEFRYDRKHLGALQGLAPDHVVYVGTASKALAPGLRIGWMVVPESLTDDLTRVLGDLGMTGSLDQLALAELFDSGAYDKHVRVMRTRYRQRRDELVATLTDRVRFSGIAAGLHALIELPRNTEKTIVANAAAHRLAVHGLDTFRHRAVPRDRDALVVGFGAPSPSGWPSALDTLGRLLP